MNPETQEILNRIQHIQEYIHHLENRIEDLEIAIIPLTEKTTQ